MTLFVSTKLENETRKQNQIKQHFTRIGSNRSSSSNTTTQQQQQQLANSIEQQLTSRIRRVWRRNIFALQNATIFVC